VTEQPAPTDDLTDEDLLALDQLALERTKRKETIDAETQRVKEIDAILRDRLPAGTTTTGACKVTVSRGRQTINADRFAAAFPPAVFPDCYRTVPAAKADVEKEIGSNVLTRAGVLDEGTPTVTVR
jgi:hypothetical protein